MFYWFFTVFVLLHGLAHMVYTALARGWIPVAAGQTDWTGTSWLFVRQLGVHGTRNLGAIVFTLLTLAFIVATAGMGFRQPWANTWLAGASVASSLALLIFWDGTLTDLAAKGIIGLAINIALLIALFAFRYPAAI